jgi:hypothetical protein
MIVKKLVALSVITIAAGCGVSQSTYNSSRELLRGSPAIKSQFVANCAMSISRKPVATRQALAMIMNTSLRSAPGVYCRRVTQGIASGRISHSDLNAGTRGEVTPKVIRVLQGR